MQKNIVLFSLIVTIIIVLNCNLVYSEPIEDNIDENIKKENIGPYPTLDDLKKELKEERHNVDQQRLDEIRKKEEEKKALESEEDKENGRKPKPIGVGVEPTPLTSSGCLPCYEPCIGGCSILASAFCNNLAWDLV